ILANASLVNTDAAVTNVMISGFGTGGVISINPVKTSVNSGDVVQFSAVVTGIKDTRVDWSCSDGSITSGGLDTSPTVAGTYTIKASSTANPGLVVNGTVSVRGGPDTSPPRITNVASSAITSTGATVTWKTNEPADSVVQYGTTSSYGSSAASSS